jgi:hypothetical protein
MNGKALAQSYRGVAVLRTDLRDHGEAGFAKDCSMYSDLENGMIFCWLV